MNLRSQIRRKLMMKNAQFSEHYERQMTSIIASIFSVSCVVLLLTGCATRANNAFLKTESPEIQSRDQGGYFSVPSVEGKDNFRGILVQTEPMLTHGSFEFLEKLVQKELGSDWSVRPWGTARYLHLVFPERQDAVKATPEDISKRLIEKSGTEPFTSVPGLGAAAGKRKVVSTKILRSNDITTPEALLELDKISHLTNDAGKIAQFTVENADFMSAKSGISSATFGEFKQEPLSSTDPLWSIKFGRVDMAWQYLKEKKLQRDFGSGVTIGVIDTGHLPEHHEFTRDGVGAGARGASAGVDLTEGDNVLEANDHSPVDQFILKGAPANPGHGAAVIGILATRLPSADNKPLAFTTGLVPGAKVIPIRASNSTVYKNPKAIARAIDTLVDRKVNVISMSLGGLPEIALEEALERAFKAGVIFVAAAGNGTNFVVAPSIFPTVIAAGAGTIDCKAWSKSSPGLEVDVLAPGDNVWYPATYMNRKNEKIWSVRRGSGTSFATPYVASMAALWIQANGGIDSIANAYGVTNSADKSIIPKAFEVALKYYGLKLPQSHPEYATENAKKEFCTGYDETKKDKTGAGFVDAYNLVRAPLPTKEEIEQFYKPQVSIHGELALKLYKKWQKQGFTFFDLNPRVEAAIPQWVRERFNSNVEQTKGFVLSYLEYQYLGKKLQQNEKDKSRATESTKEDQKTQAILTQITTEVKNIVQNTCSAVKKASEKAATCDLAFLDFSHWFPEIIPADGVYFMKAFQYMAAAKGQKELTIEEKYDMISQLLEGNPQWRDGISQD